METPPKMICRWQMRIWEDAENHMSSADCKLEQEGDITTHPPEWLRSKTRTPPKAGEDVER